MYNFDFDLVETLGKDSGFFHKTIGDNIKYWRKQEGLTQKDLAQSIEMNWRQLGHYEQGRHYPNLNMVIKIFDVLKKSPLYAFYNEDYLNMLPFLDEYSELLEEEKHKEFVVDGEMINLFDNEISDTKKLKGILYSYMTDSEVINNPNHFVNPPVKSNAFVNYLRNCGYKVTQSFNESLNQNIYELSKSDNLNKIKITEDSLIKINDLINENITSYLSLFNENKD